MKKNKLKIIVLITSILLGSLYSTRCLAGFGLGGTSIYNTTLNNAISGGTSDVDPIRYGIQTVTTGVTSTGGIAGILHTNIITNHMEALNSTLRVVQNIVNYALGLVGLIALIYILVHGFIILTAAGDDAKQKKGLKGIKNGFLAMAGIGLSWIIVSFILRLINTLVS